MLITSSIVLDSAILLVLLIYFVYIYICKKQTYWQKRGVYCPQFKSFFGHFLDVMLLKTTVAELLKKHYNEINEDCFGVYIFGDPYLVVKSPKLLKNILIKDFSHFTDRNIAAPDHSPVTAHMLFMQKSPKWKYARNKISIAFTSGKLKAMFPLLESSADELGNFLLRRPSVVDAKELTAKYATDVISKCAFGIEAYCFAEKDSVFFSNGKKMFTFTWRNAFAQMAYGFKPDWVEKLKLEFIEKNVVDYFTNIFMTTMKSRQGNTRKYHDVIDIMNELKEKNELKSDGSDDYIFSGIAMLFFAAGYETTSSTISFTLYEFAMNPDIQHRVRTEVECIIEKHGGLTYDAVNEMRYLEMCINETTRKYPLLPFLDRKCNLDYPVPGTNIVIEKGTPILIPTLGFHRNENHFPEPQKYDPERFATKLDNTNGLYYMPFGEGPRNCLGERFGKMSTKLAVIGIIRKFEITKCSKTPDPVVFEPKCFFLHSKVGLPLKYLPL